MLINSRIPLSNDGTYDSCHLYYSNHNNTGEDVSNATLISCSSWVYDTSTFTSTLGAKVYSYFVFGVSDFDFWKTLILVNSFPNQ